jgi:pimeloyl-ACP methyl ester carboxylesterase
VRRSRWTSHDGVRLHYLDSGLAVPPTPVVFVPGLSDVADEYDWLLDAWAPRRTVVVDLRGRGASDAPRDGYTIDHHTGDLDTVIEACGINRMFLVSFSRGTAYALRWALDHPDRVAGLVVGDYNAKQPSLGPEFPAWWMSTRWRGRNMTEIMPPHVIEGLQRDSVELLFWDEMKVMDCPVLVIRGGKGLMDDEAMGRWQMAVPHVESVTFDDSYHDIFRPDPDRYATTVRRFLDANDRD